MNINEFKTALSEGGARANLFEVTIATPPAGAGSLSNFKFLCKTTTIPTSVIAPISIPFMGRDIKMAGDRTFDTWSTTIINDEDFGIRDTLERWLDHIKGHEGVKQKIGKYKRTATVTQLDKQGEESREIRIASINVRQDGQGYGRIRLDMDLENDFEKQMRGCDEKVHGGGN